MGIFDSIVNLVKEQCTEENLNKILDVGRDFANKQQSAQNACSFMSENELIDTYCTAKRNREYILMSNAAHALKERFFYTQEEIENLY